MVMAFSKPSNPRRRPRLLPDLQRGLLPQELPMRTQPAIIARVTKVLVVQLPALAQLVNLLTSRNPAHITSIGKGGDDEEEVRCLLVI